MSHRVGVVGDNSGGLGTIEEQGLIERILSGGQTGVDRAALDVALELGIPCGGWCPAGRRAEDGRIPAIYPVQETESRNYAVRTRRNVRDTDGTLVLVNGPVSGGTRLTVKCADDENKPRGCRKSKDD